MAGMSAQDAGGYTPETRAWPGPTAAALLLLAIARGTIDNAWDGWCTVFGVGGLLALVVWMRARRANARLRPGSRASTYGMQAVGSVLLTTAAVALLNYLAARHNRTFDYTESRLFTLSPQTTQVLRALPHDVRLLAFLPASRRGQAVDLLRRYAQETPRLHYELVDPDQEPERAQKYGVTSYGTIVVETDGARGRKPVRIEAEARARSFALSEERLTNALLKATQASTKVLYFLEGHGEGDTGSDAMNGYSRVRTALEDQGYTVRPLFLARSPVVPADCAVLLIAGPGREPLPDEMAAVQRYLEAGGRVLILVDPAPGAGMETFLTRWGLRVGNDLVVDASGAGRIYGAGPAMPLVKDYSAQHPITRDFRVMTFFPLVRSITPQEATGDASVAALAETGPESFAETYAGGARRARIDPAHDRKGPIPVAAAVTRSSSAGREARLVAIGSSNFISNAFFARAGNGDLFLNAVNWLAEEEARIALRPRPRDDRTAQLTEQQMRGLFWIVVLVMPGGALAAGAIVAWRRR